MNGCIYKITNIVNNKIYIGQTDNLERRKREHKAELIRGKHSNGYLQNSFNYHGIDNFSIEIIGEYPVADLDEKEREWIKHYNSCDKNAGYNFTPGGGSLRGSENPFYGEKHTVETRKKMSNSRKGKYTGENNHFSRMDFRGAKNGFYGKKHTDEIKREMSKQRKGLFAGSKNYFYGKSFKGEEHPMYGEKHTDESINKMRKNAPNKKINENDVKDIINRLLNTDVNITELAGEYGVTKTTISGIKNNRKFKYILPELRDELKSINMFDRRSKRNKLVQ